MKKIVSIILMLCVSVAVFSGCGKKEENTAAKSTSAVNVTVHKVSKNDINSEVTYTGEIKASEESDVSPEISATIQAINCEIGDHVNAGDVLAVLDDTSYRLAYNQAQAAYNSAVASYNSATNGSMKQTKSQLETALSSAEIQYNNALDNYNRQKELYDVGAISKVALESAETSLKNAELNLESAKTTYNITIGEINEDTKISAQATVDSAKAALAIAENNLNNTRIVAPISGYVASKNGNMGQMAVAGSPMFSIKSSDIVNVEISVTESVIPYITTDTKATISVETADVSNIEGVVTAVNTVKSSVTGMYTVKIRINNDNNVLKIGMMANVVLQTEAKKDAVIIPTDSVMQENNEYYVYVVTGDTAEKRKIETGITNNNFTEVVSGIENGETVVVSGKEYISEKNNKVNIVEE